MVGRCKDKDKATLKAVKYTDGNRDQILELLGSWGDLDPLHKGTYEIWVSSWSGGDRFDVGDYLVYDGEWFNFPELETLYKPTSDKDGMLEVWEKIEPEMYEFLQWTGENTDECLDFIGHHGGLESSGTQILICSTIGGSICNKNDYILRHKDFCWTVSDLDFHHKYAIV